MSIVYKWFMMVSTIQRKSFNDLHWLPHPPIH